MANKDIGSSVEAFRTVTYCTEDEIKAVLNESKQKIRIGDETSDSIRHRDFIRLSVDAEKYINAKIRRFCPTIPLKAPIPDEINFATCRLAAFFVHTSIFSTSNLGEDETVTRWFNQANEIIIEFIASVEEGILCGSKGSSSPRAHTKDRILFPKIGIPNIERDEANPKTDVIPVEDTDITISERL